LQKLIDVTDSIIQNVLSILLQDKTTGKNIIWATDAYAGIDEKSEMTVNQIMNNPGIICPRVLKSKAEQIARSRKKAEVFTPAWLVNKMNNFIDEDWFGRKNVFNIENNDNPWTANEDCIKFKDDTDGEDYICSRRLEITCGEAPYLATRYDAATGEIIPLINRVGILDRKLRVICENTENIFDWWLYATLAFKSVYGYEYQGDNILIARINLLLTFVDYYEECFKIAPGYNLIEDIAKIVTKNIWQMDGLTNKQPFSDLNAESNQLSLFDCAPKVESAPFSRIFNHSENKYILFSELKEMKSVGKKLFDYVIGNPPYQEEAVGEQKQFAPPVYDKFMESAYEIADKVELITPARFLFNAGGTSKDWNKKMLKDEHLKVLYHEQDSSKVFSNTDIKGGVAITYRDSKKIFGAIGVYTPYPTLNKILDKVGKNANQNSLNLIISNRGLYKFSKKMYQEQESEMKKMADSRVGASSFERMPELFTEEKPNDEFKYVKFLGLLKAKRVYRWFRMDYFNPVESLSKYKVMFPAANGSGQFGEILSMPVIGEPYIGHTETFISIGSFDNVEEANACFKYICSKFCRSMLGVLKITQHCSPEKWAYVPLQDFTKNSDIDWTKDVAEIDRMLYKKYSLSEEEIEFIETHVKEMT